MSDDLQKMLDECYPEIETGRLLDVLDAKIETAKRVAWFSASVDDPDRQRSSARVCAFLEKQIHELCKLIVPEETKL